MFLFSLWTKQQEPATAPPNGDDTFPLVTSNGKDYSTISPEQPESLTDPLDFMLTTHPLPDDEANDDIKEAPNDYSSPTHRARKKLHAFYAANNFLILIMCAILMAYVYPPLGAVYLAPQITATWIAVVFIFILAGMSIKTEEFSKAFTRFYFNLFVQGFNFGVVSFIVYGLSRVMLSMHALPESLADGMTICASLPISVNAVQVLTKSSGGDEASAIFHAAFGNLVGIFLSPALILLYLGVMAEVDLRDVFATLILRVVLPVVIGQVLQQFVPPAKEFVKHYKKYIKVMQERCLVFIVYTVFCETFLQGSDASTRDVVLMIAFECVIMVLLMIIAWALLRMLFPTEPKLQVMGLFGCTHKTLAVGVPLIGAIYGRNPLVGLYTLPILVWHPLQLVLGSALTPRLACYVKNEEERLGLVPGSTKMNNIKVSSDNK
ncbi:hypothetical protein ACHAW6_013267 [Cyclotella cf. meneghiniana]